MKKFLLAFSTLYALRTANYSRGMTMMDTVVGTALLLIVFMGVAAAFQLSVDVVTNNKARAGAIALGNERMEYVRSLSYSAIGTSGGIPSGTIAQSETVTLNNIPYTRRTTIEYVDDPGDGTGASDANSITVDYKSVRVDVAWASKQGTRHITTVTRIEPPNGLEIACSSCGTLSITVRNAALALLPNAQVQITNAGTSPAINITTFSNASGAVVLPGAPAASGYQVVVSESGYSTDQTYTSTSQNSNPSPANLTVSNGQTTSAAFAIDVLATKNIYTWTQVLSGTWSETMSDTSKIASSTNVTVAAGIARLSGASGSYPTYGELQSIAIGPSALARWRTLTLTHTKPASTNIVYHLYDGAGTTLIPDTQVFGNSTGIATSSNSVDLTGISTSTYPAITLDATFSSSNPANTPSIDAYTILYDYGPNPLPNIAFNMTGAKKMGNGPPILYKYNQNLSTGAQGGLTLPSIEWDTYTISVASSTGYDLASSCGPQPELLSPGTNVRTDLFLAAHSGNSLLVDVSSGGVYLPNTSVNLWRPGVATTTVITDGCGQSFFASLATTTYYMSVATSSHPTYWNTNPGVGVSGNGRLSITLN